MKLKLNTKICYLIGLCNRNENSIYISTEYDEILEKFIEIAINELSIKPDKIIINKKENKIIAFSYNSKIKNFFISILETRDYTFKYFNDYSSNYFAGLFDSKGYIENNHLYFKSIDLNDQMILEKFKIHLRKTTNNSYKIISQNLFIILVKQNSVKINLFFKKEKL